MTFRATTEGEDDVAVLLDALDRAYDDDSFHGPNLSSTFRRVKPYDAAWRPAPGRHCIAEHLLHAAYWKYAVRRRLRGDQRGSFAIKGSNWFAVDAELTPTAWRMYKSLIDAEHVSLRETFEGLSAGRLRSVAPGGQGKYTVTALILGVAAHDVYHAGQIQLLKALRKGESS